MSPKKLFIIDAMAMAFRNFHAFGVRPLTTANGLPTSAVYGSAVSMLKLIDVEKPDYLIVATDSKEPTFRHELYPAYKANRTLMPEELAAQLPYFFRLFTALGCAVLKCPGVEADDLIGTIVKKHAGPDLHCFIVSGDKDFMQLVNEHIFLYVPKKGGLVEMIREEQVVERFGGKGLQVTDALALIGDSSDNVPGVKGIGEKGAAKLVKEFGSIENIYANLAQVTNPKINSALASNRPIAELSKRLVTIKCDVEVDKALTDFAFSPSTAVANRELLKLFDELEFRTLSAAVKEKLAAVPQAPAAKASGGTTSEAVVGRDYKLINTQARWAGLTEKLYLSEQFCFDTETTGLDIIADKPVGISFCFTPGEAYYVPLHKKHLLDLDPEAVIANLKVVFTDPNKLKVAHNIKFDMQMLANIDVQVTGPTADTMLCSYLLEATAMSHGLDQSCEKYLSFTKIPTASLIGANAEIGMLDVDLERLTEYACEDVDYTLRLYNCFKPLLTEQRLVDLFNNIEMPLANVLAAMEKTGVFVDAEVLAQISQNLDILGKDLEQKIYQHAGETFKIGSTKQLQVILYERLKIHEQLGVKRLKKTKTGYSTDVSVLEKLSAHPLVQAILDYRTVTKLKNTYVDTLPQLIHRQTQRIHTSFHQTGTATGRLSSSNPNLQNIPIRSTLGREIRKAFCPQNKEHQILSADYSQVELRLLAHLSDDANLISAFRSGEDIHRSTAAKIFGVAGDAVTAEMRSQAKAINFGIIYGMGPSRLARETGVSFGEAKDFIEKYFTQYPRIHEFIETAIEQARRNGYTLTITGRKRPLPEINSRDPMLRASAENIAVNSPIQGSAADLIKIAMINIAKSFAEQKLQSRMLLQVHDELVFEVANSELELVQALVRDKMQNAMPLKVPVLVEMGAGPNWLEAH